MKLVLLPLFLLATVAVTRAQSKTELGTSFKAVDAYQADNNLVLFPKFDRKGRVCQVSVEQRQDHDPTRNVKPFNDETAEKLLATLIPEAQRGKRVSPFFSPDSWVAGGQYMTRVDYEYVSIEKAGYVDSPKDQSLQVVRVFWVKRKCAAK